MSLQREKDARRELEAHVSDERGDSDRVRQEAAAAQQQATAFKACV